MAVLYFHLKGFKIHSANKKYLGKYYYSIFNHKSGICSEKFPFQYGKHKVSEYFHIKLDNNKYPSFTIKLYKKGILKDKLIATCQFDTQNINIDTVYNVRKLMCNRRNDFPHVSCSVSIHLSSTGLNPYQAPVREIDNVTQYLEAAGNQQELDNFFEELLRD
ncbi:hypothetical protein TVAG_198870 [Trichomonas vaginalis G3]|uniref:Uncharacterized protein n=1 Tax=Trichomonas vaginalis (strain ATCC PRA-98 / G3) TaxID=412133 RepID=A2DDS2_TRIV3|nr:hypothetical protein TVAGG3_0999330 [Trichomonas vaginalis G3]EAY21448.1 hypothetical protein TVAG_198870 [Trichomonas vaginalis G3]KAI5490661.1 hypothetical protein TVAGG3_0999330 [Trichomonas vaginalis G3]|eukprot:XP_001582434.1 hypothetical protein [Trichomonas vaginalis G3]